MLTDSRRFPYVPVANARGETALRPQLPLTLTYQGRSVAATGLLDTGADVNVLPYGGGLALGAVWADQGLAVVLSGNLARYEARGIIVAATVEPFAPVRLAFAWTQTDEVPLLLGQVNFFLEFDTCFFRAEAAFEVRPKLSRVPR